MDKINIGHAPKSVAVGDSSWLHFWYSNNKGRGGDNCTIVRSWSMDRSYFSRCQPEVIATIKTSAWAGKVNFSTKIQRGLRL